MKNLIRRASYRLGINVHKPLAFIYDLPSIWGRPFDKLHLPGVGCEVGVYSGFHARDLMLKPEVTGIHLVDPYEEYASEASVGGLKEAETCAHRLMRRFGNKVIWHRAMDTLPGLDWCYIDANHDYEPVARDIAVAWEKVRRGGIIGGHDFHATKIGAHPGFPGVIRAVTEFTVNNRLELNVVTPDWWFVRE